MANLNPPEVWLFQNQSGHRFGKGFVEPVISESREKMQQKILSPRRNEDSQSPWSVLLLMIVFTTGGTMILYYISTCFLLSMDRNSVWNLQFKVLPEASFCRFY